MFDYIKGEIVKKNEHAVVIDNNGIGYYLHISTNTFQKLPEIGEAFLLNIHVIHKDDSFELLGFFSERERVIFRKLISLSGIGPKQALKILSGITIEQFIESIISEDIIRLTKIQGLGKKTAEKLIFELKDKLDGVVTNIKTETEDKMIPEDAVSALEALGFSRIASRAAVLAAIKEGGESKDLQTIIRMALRHV